MHSHWTWLFLEKPELHTVNGITAKIVCIKKIIQKNNSIFLDRNHLKKYKNTRIVWIQKIQTVRYVNQKKV